MNGDTSEEYRYSQDETWEINESAATRLSETEIAELARLRDSLEQAHKESFKSFPHSPVLSPPKPKALRRIFLKISKNNVQTCLSSIEDFDIFLERFPEEFAAAAIVKEAKTTSRQFIDINSAVFFAVCKKMQTLMRIYNDPAFKRPYQKLRIRMLKASYPRVKIFLDTLMKMALDLNLPQDLAEERTWADVLRIFDPQEELLPQKSAVKKTFIKEVFKLLKEENTSKQALRTAYNLSLALDAEEAFAKFCGQIKANPPREYKNSEFELKESCKRFGQMSVVILGLKTSLKTPLLLALFLGMIHDLDQAKNGEAEKIAAWIGSGILEAVQTEERFLKVLPLFELSFAVLEKTGWIPVLIPSEKLKRTLMKTARILPTLKPEEVEFSGNMQLEEEQIRHFFTNVLGFHQYGEVNYAPRSSERA